MRAITPSETSIYHLLFKIVGLIVEHPDQVSIRTAQTDDQVTFAIWVHSDDIARLKGDEDRIERAIQTVIDAMALGSGRSLHIVIPRAPEEDAVSADADVSSMLDEVT